MGAYSISFTLGKASSEHGGNIQHNNRKFTAPNVDPEKEKDNIYYKTQDIREAYHNLFDEAVEEYNKKQTRPCRKIKNYFEHINEGKREEIFYETVVQFGNFDDSDETVIVRVLVWRIATAATSEKGWKEGID